MEGEHHMDKKTKRGVFEHRRRGEFAQAARDVLVAEGSTVEKSMCAVLGTAGGKTLYAEFGKFLTKEFEKNPEIRQVNDLVAEAVDVAIEKQIAALHASGNLQAAVEALAKLPLFRKWLDKAVEPKAVPAVVKGVEAVLSKELADASLRKAGLAGWLAEQKIDAYHWLRSLVERPIAQLRQAGDLAGAAKETLALYAHRFPCSTPSESEALGTRLIDMMKEAEASPDNYFLCQQATYIIGPEAEIFQACQQKDYAAAVVAAWRIHNKHIWQVCFAYVHCPADADDAAGSFWALVVEKLPAFRWDSRWLNWAHKTARGLCLDHHEAGSKRQEVPLAASANSEARSAPPPAVGWNRGKRSGVLSNLLSADVSRLWQIEREEKWLPERQREVLMLRNAGYSYEEISEELDLSYDYARKLDSLARNTMLEKGKEAMTREGRGFQRNDLSLFK